GIQPAGFSCAAGRGSHHAGFAGCGGKCSTCGDGGVDRDVDRDVCRDYESEVGMNCANHADASAVAYCRTCGKALCANCTRPVRGVIYCEDCLGAKMEGVPTGAAGFVPGTVPAAVPGAGAAGIPAASSGPNPTVAGILGAIPFGIGAVYNGQYAKGLVHLGIFALLVAGCNAGGDLLPTICGLGISFFIVYQIVDAVRSARAIQAGLPAPDPYGLAATFGGGAKIETSKIPMGAIMLILLGVLFLL